MFKPLKQVPVEHKQEQVKLHYTVTPIGGKKDLKEWKVEQKRLEEVYQVKKVIKDQQVKAESVAIIMQEKKPRELTRDELSEINWTKQFNYGALQQKDTMTEQEYREFCLKAKQEMLSSIAQYQSVTPISQQKPLLTRLKEFCGNQLRKTFFY